MHQNSISKREKTENKQTNRLRELLVAAHVVGANAGLVGRHDLDIPVVGGGERVYEANAINPPLLVGIAQLGLDIRLHVDEQWRLILLAAAAAAVACLLGGCGERGRLRCRQLCCTCRCVCPAGGAILATTRRRVLIETLGGAQRCGDDRIVDAAGERLTHGQAHPTAAPSVRDHTVRLEYPLLADALLVALGEHHLILLLLLLLLLLLIARDILRQCGCDGRHCGDTLDRDHVESQVGVLHAEQLRRVLVVDELLALGSDGTALGSHRLEAARAVGERGDQALVQLSVDRWRVLVGESVRLLSVHVATFITTIFSS